MASSIRPQFFCSRPNGTLTPLVALDELPAHVSIRGVPRVLSPGDTQGMTSLGTVSPRAQFYVIDGISSNPTRAASTGNQSAQQRSRDVDIQNSLLKVVTDDSLPASQRLAFHALIQHGLAQNWVMSNPATSNWLASHTGGNAVVNGRQGPHYNVKKEYCSYWIRHGECDYQQQGCLYKHEMPTDPSMLEKLGLRDIPRWYREKYGIPSLIPGGHHNSRSHHANHGQHWKDSDVPDRGPLKTIQYASRSGPHGNADHTAGEADKGLKQKSAPNFQPVLQQPVVATQGQARTPFGPGMFSKGSVSHKQATKHVPAQQNVPPTKKIDLLSFDPLPDYRTFDHVNGNLNEPPYNTAAEEADRAQRQDLVRSLQSLVPAPTSAPGNPELLPSPIDSTMSHGRNNTTTRKQHQQRSRRLYQPRSQITVPEINPNAAMDIGPFKSNDSNNRQSSVATLSSPASAVSKDSTQMTSPIADPVVGNKNDMPSDPPTRVATPSMHSQSSSSSASIKKLPSPFPRAPGGGGCGGNRPRPGPIGSKKGHRKRSADPPHEDLITVVGRGN